MASTIHVAWTLAASLRRCSTASGLEERDTEWYGCFRRDLPTWPSRARSQRRQEPRSGRACKYLEHAEVGRPGLLLDVARVSARSAFLSISATWSSQARSTVINRPLARVDPRFLLVLPACGDDLLDEYVRQHHSHVRTVKRSRQLGDMPVSEPPLDEQRAIADYLDRETARIDTLIEDQQRLIEMLRERRRAVVEQAVALGLESAADQTTPSRGFLTSAVPQLARLLATAWLSYRVPAQQDSCRRGHVRRRGD